MFHVLVPKMYTGCRILLSLTLKCAGFLSKGPHPRKGFFPCLYLLDFSDGVGMGEDSLEPSLTVSFNVKTVCQRAKTEDSWPSVYKLDPPCSAWLRHLVFLWGRAGRPPDLPFRNPPGNAAANQQGNFSKQILN